MQEVAGRELEGRETLNVRGERLGKIDAVFAGKDGKPGWARVKLGRLGLHKAIVPLEMAEDTGGKLTLPYETDHIHHAPDVDPQDGRFDDAQLDLLCRHYGLEPVAPPSGIAEDDIELPRETRDAKPPALDEDEDSPLVKRRRERARELGVPHQD
jgi:hypothetical protein